MISWLLGCDHRIVVGEDHFKCQNEVLTTLSTAVPGNSTLYLCPWKQGAIGLIHFKLAMNLLRCEVLPEESLYLFNGNWKLFPRDEEPLSKLNVEIRPDPALESVDHLYLTVSAN